MAILHRKEEKIQVVLGRLPKKYTHEQFVEMFIRLYSKDWGKIKSAYIKQSQDREPGTVVNMPKPDLYLKQILATYLSSPTVDTVKEKPVIEEVPVVKAKAAPKKKETLAEVEEAPVKKAKVATKKVAEAAETTDVVKKPKVASKKKAVAEEEVELPKKPKAATKEKIAGETAAPVKEVKKKAPAKKKADDEAAPVKAKKAKTSEK